VICSTENSPFSMTKKWCNNTSSKKVVPWVSVLSLWLLVLRPSNNAPWVLNARGVMQRRLSIN
jgi:hypothetical protein